MAEDVRIVRVPLPLDLIRRMDKLIVSGKGGYGTRGEFIREAIEAMVLECTYAQAPKELLSSTNTLASNNQATGRDHESAQGTCPLKEERPFALTDTRIHAPSPGYVLANGVAQVADEPIFGLHNRDYPSIWAAGRIAARTSDGAMDAGELFAEVVADAWLFAKKLLGLEKCVGRKLTALFPTNEGKVQTASAGFCTFAVGRYSASGSRVMAEGPLFKWHVVQIEEQNGRLAAGITAAGYRLLELLDGISLDLPHARKLAERFLDHIRLVAPRDWWGFATVLSAARDGAGRTELVASFQREHSAWNVNKASNYAAGYVARAREWGLLEPKLVDRRYRLTDLGRQQLKRDGSKK